MEKLIEFFLVCILISFSNGRIFTIHCGSCNFQKTISNGNCTVTTVPREIYANDVVSKPSWKDLSWNIYQKTDGQAAIAFNVTWFLRGDKMSGITGFLLSVTRTSSSVSEYRKMDISLDESVQLNSSDTVYINYPCYGKKFYEKVRPNHAYSMAVRSLPSYSLDGKPPVIYNSIYIDCEDERIRNFPECSEEYY